MSWGGYCDGASWGLLMIGIGTIRNFTGIELDDKYFEIAKRRISEAQNKPEQITMG